MTKFDYMNFTGGYGIEFVAHANKYSKEEAVGKCIKENEHLFEGLYRKPTVKDIQEDFVKYYVKCPSFCGYDADGGGCYTFTEETSKGSFPVWVIDISKLKEE